MRRVSTKARFWWTFLIFFFVGKNQQNSDADNIDHASSSSGKTSPSHHSVGKVGHEGQNSPTNGGADDLPNAAVSAQNVNRGPLGPRVFETTQPIAAQWIKLDLRLYSLDYIYKYQELNQVNDYSKKNLWIFMWKIFLKIIKINNLIA